MIYALIMHMIGFYFGGVIGTGSMIWIYDRSRKSIHWSWIWPYVFYSMYIEKDWGKP
jgi:hypothetical protein